MKGSILAAGLSHADIRLLMFRLRLSIAVIGRLTMNEKLTAIADEIIGYSDGSFYIAWGEEYTALTPEEQSEVDTIVYDSIGNCNECGWNFTYDSMETHSDGESYCWHCYEDVIEREEGEDNED
jgi:hypothetical protein